MDIAPDPPPVPALAGTAALPAGQNPVLIYLASLAPGTPQLSG